MDDRFALLAAVTETVETIIARIRGLTPTEEGGGWPGGGKAG